MLLRASSSRLMMGWGGPAKSFTEEALLAAITKIELGNPQSDFVGGPPART
jgi:hypothetical protein